MDSGTIKYKLTRDEANVLSHFRHTPIFAGLEIDRAPSDSEFIEALVYFTKIAVQRIAGELNTLVDFARKYVPKQPWEEGYGNENPEGHGEGVKEVELNLTDWDVSNLATLTTALESSGIPEFEDPSTLIHLCMEVVFNREGFDGTLKKKFLDALFISILYGIKATTVLMVLNEAAPQKAGISAEEQEILKKMRGENQAFDNFRSALYSKPESPTEATLVIQRYGSGSTDPSKASSAKGAITLTERDFTLEFHVARMRQFRSTVGDFDFESLVLGYAFHTLSWTDGVYNMPYIARRMFSMTYPPPPPRVSAEIRRVRAGFQYQPTVDAFEDYRESYSYSAWALDTMLSDFYRACRVFE